MKNRSETGFTLIEIVIVLGIVSILATIAYSAYSNNVISAKRTDGRKALQQVATTLEKCKALYGAFNSPNCSISDGSSVASIEGLYDVAVTSTASTFTLTASPSTGSSQQNDTDCTSITLDNLGLQSGSGSDPTQCW